MYAHTPDGLLHCLRAERRPFGHGTRVGVLIVKNYS